jgi:hypothetical protein
MKFTLELDSWTARIVVLIAIWPSPNPLIQVLANSIKLESLRKMDGCPPHWHASVA